VSLPLSELEILQAKLRLANWMAMAWNHLSNFMLFGIPCLYIVYASLCALNLHFNGFGVQFPGYDKRLKNHQLFSEDK
jgi:hypothetical protein